jgi:hypothetical protein
MSVINQKFWQLQKERRDYSSKVMEEYDKEYNRKMQELYKECEEDGGHKLMFDNINPLGYPIFYCTRCNKTEIEKE